MVRPDRHDGGQPAALPPARPHTIGFSGYNGRGIAPGTVFGRCLADLVLGRIDEAELPLPVTDPVPAAIAALKEAWYEVGAQLAHAASARF